MMSGPLQEEYFCVAEDNFSEIVDKLRQSNLENADKDLIAHILLNHRHVMLGLLNGKIKGKELEQQIKRLAANAKKHQKEKDEAAAKLAEKDSSEQAKDTEENDVSQNPIASNLPKNTTTPNGDQTNKPDDSQDNTQSLQNNEGTTITPSSNNAPGKIKPQKKRATKKQKKKKEGKRGHKKFSGAEKKYHIFDPNFIQDSPCPCCGESNRLYSLTPAVTVLFSGNSPVVPKVHITEKARCKSCGVTVGAPVPVEVENSLGRFLPSAVAQFALQRFHLGFPHSRMETLTNLYEQHIPDSNQWGAIDSAAMEMEPLLECLAHNVANAKWIGIDDAKARVIELNKKICTEIKTAKDEQEARTGIQSTLHEKDFRTGVQSTVFVANTFSNHNITFYMTGRNHQGENKAAILELRTNSTPPIIMTDAANKALMKIKNSNNIETIDTNCLQHFRLKIHEVAKNFPKEAKYLLEEIAKVYRNDSYCKKQGLNDLHRLAYHCAHSEPIMTNLEHFIKKELKENPRAEPNGEYAKKVLNYAINHWSRLTGFLKYSGAALDNNPTERKTKPVVRYRDNSKKYLTEHGASIGDFYMSLIETCQLNNLNPKDYLEFCITHRKLIPDDPELFLPWNYLETKRELEEQLKNRPRYRILSQRGAYIPKGETLSAQQ